MASTIEEVVREHADGVWRFAASVLGDHHLAEDATQETFLKASRALDTYRGEGSMRAWLLAICSRVCTDAQRRKRLAVVPLEDRPDDTRLEARAELRDAVGRLPDDERAAFVLVCVLGHSREEAARIEGVPASTMRSRTTRARERLADALRDPEDPR